MRMGSKHCCVFRSFSHMEDRGSRCGARRARGR